MSDFINNPDLEYNKDLAESLYTRNENQDGVKNITYDIDSNSYTLNYNGGSTINMYSTSQMLDYYFGENLSDVIADDKIFIVNQSSYDLIYYEGTFIGYGVDDSSANQAFETAFDTEIKALVNDNTFINSCADFVENNIVGSVSTGTIMPSILDIYDKAKDKSGSTSFKYSTCLSLALIFYHLNYTGNDNSANSSEWLNVFSTAFSFDTNPFTSAILTGLPAVTNIISNEAERNINFYISQYGFTDPDFNTTKPFNGRSLQEWMEDNGFNSFSKNIDFNYNGTLSIPFDYETILQNYNLALEEAKKPTFWEWIKSLFDDFFYDYECLSCDFETVGEKIKGNYLGNIRTRVLTARKIKYDPLILDLDGDGFNIEKKEDGANFDLDKNGFAEKINWTKKDGFLCLDLNGNGTIDNGGELFGDKTLLADGTTAKNGFEALAQYDGNGDGVIDENDEIFGSLRVWVDADGNGASGEGEMKTLAELGITSINLGYENVNAETDTEATIGNAAGFTRADGTTGSIGELWVSSDLFDTVESVDIEISEDIKELPDIRSIGNVHSLHNAMALDETGELKALVESFAAEQDTDKRMALAEQILYFICGANDVADGSRGAYMDAKQLTVIEAMLGEEYIGTTGANPHSDAAPMLKAAYKDLLNLYYNELNVQTHIKDYAALLRYTENEDGTKTLNADLVNYVLEYQLAHGDEQAKSILGDVARYIQYLDNGGIKGINDFAMNYAKISAEYAAEVFKIMPNGFVADGTNPLSGTSSADFLAGSDNGETITGGSGNDVIVGGKGNDTLYGGYGNDTYVFNLGDGNDVINEQNSNSALDKIVFGEGISAEDISVDRIGNDMILKINDNGDSIRIVRQYNDSWYRIENFEFADGTTVGADYFYNQSLTITGSGEFSDFSSGYGTRDTTLIGSDAADTIYGYEGTDTLIGGKGNDTLYGGYGNDTYIFNLGDGNDVINEQNSNSSSDKIVFGEGLSINNIIFSNTGKSMEITFTVSTDSVTITNQNYDSWYRVEGFVTSDGYSIDYNRVNQLIQAMASFEEDTGMDWAEAIEHGNETATDIVSQMWIKSVS